MKLVETTKWFGNNCVLTDVEKDLIYAKMEIFEKSSLDAFIIMKKMMWDKPLDFDDIDFIIERFNSSRDSKPIELFIQKLELLQSQV